MEPEKSEAEIRAIIDKAISEARSGMPTRQDAIAKDGELKSLEDSLIAKVQDTINTYQTGQNPTPQEIMGRIKAISGLHEAIVKFEKDFKIE